MNQGIWKVLRHDEQSELFWYWLPGWSFQPEVFKSLSKQLPGTHLGLDHLALFKAIRTDGSSAPTFADAVTAILKQTRHSGHWIGWSLGGALAQACCSQLQQQPQGAIDLTPLILTTMATGNSFLQYNVGEHGMAADVFFAFCRSLDKMPAKTLKRFVALCCQGVENQRELATHILKFQFSGEDEHLNMLSNSLQWLTQYQLNKHFPLTDGFDSTAIYAANDAMSAGGLQARQLLTLGHSHALPQEQQALDALQQLLANKLQPAGTVETAGPLND